MTLCNPHIQEAVRQLQQLASSPARLTPVLTELVATTEKQRRRATAREQHLLEDEQASSQLDYSYTVVKKLLDSQLVGMELPKVVVTFAEQAWSKVLFLSHLREGEASSAWQSARQVLDQVVDLSLLGKEFSPQIAEEFLNTVRLKLAEIALDPYQTEHLIRDMEQLMVAGARGSLENVERVCVEEVYPSIPGEQRIVVGESGEESVEENYLHDAESIPAGNWVEFKKPGGCLRARFIGTAGPLNKLIFVDRQGLKVSEGDSQQVALELKRGNLVILDNSPLFDRALAAVVDNMRSGK